MSLKIPVVSTITSKIPTVEKMASKCPEISIGGKVFENAADLKLWHNKAIIGLSGLVTQTAIDLTNPLADKETRKKSGFRTASKMTVTTLAGCGARYCGELVGDKLAANGKVKPTKQIIEAAGKEFKSLSEAELNGKFGKLVGKISKNCPDDIMKIARAKQGKAFGAIAGIVGAVGTIFFLDVPFIDPFMNKMMEWYDKHNEQKGGKK